MGDLFFILRMAIYTFFLVVILQVKVGSSTLEQKLHNLTHQSELAGFTQGIAQGGAAFIGKQYSRLTGNINSKFFNKLSSSERPGQRLQHKLKDFSETLDKKWEEAEGKAEELTED